MLCAHIAHKTGQSEKSRGSKLPHLTAHCNLDVSTASYDSLLLLNLHILLIKFTPNT